VESNDAKSKVQNDATGEKMMKGFLTAVLGMFVIVSGAALAGGQRDREGSASQKSASKEGKTSATALAQRPLVLSGSVPMDGVKGRFDHFCFRKGSGIHFRARQ
jgi:hypothetical protein